MATQKTTKYKIPNRAVYFTRAKPLKKFRLWIPSDVENSYLEDPDSPSIMSFVYYLEAFGIKRIDTSIYNSDPSDPNSEPDFDLFYQIHLERYSNEKGEFCSSVMDGGVSSGYIIDTANAKRGYDTVTLLSLDIDDDDNIGEIYGLITFRLVTKTSELDTIMVDTLCGNQALPGSGEGTRLLNYIQSRAKEVGIVKIVLHPVDTAVQYYQREKFRPLKREEAQLVNSSDSDSDELTMQKNVRASSNWNKLKNSVRLLGIYKNTKKARRLREIKEQIQNKAQTLKNSGSKKGKPIPAPFTTKTRRFRPKETPYKKSENAIPIVPGATLTQARLRDEIKEAETRTRSMQKTQKRTTKKTRSS